MLNNFGTFATAGEGYNTLIIRKLTHIKEF